MPLMLHRAVVSTIAAGLAAASLAGCGSSSPSNGPGQSPSSTPTPSATASGSPSPTMSGSPTATATQTGASSSIGLCTSNIRVISGQPQGAAGHLTIVLIFNNVGHTPCRMRGYPGLDVVTPSGHLVAHARRTLNGMAGGATSIATITLAAGGSASALVEASDVPQGGISNCGNYPLQVTPPEQYVAVPAGLATMPQCALEIHPVVAGTHGGMR